MLELCWASSLIFVGNDPSFTDGGGRAELDTTGVDAAKIKLEFIEFQYNVAAKEILFNDTPENLSKEGISKIFPPLTICQWKFLLCLGLPAAARGVNCPLQQATVNVKHGPELSLYLVIVFFWFSVLFFAFYEVFFGDYGLVVQPFTSGFTIISHTFLSVASDSTTVASGPLSATFSLLAQMSSYATNCWQEQVSHLHDE